MHPLELARQVTLYEWDLYSRIEFCEVNGSERNWGVNMRRSLDFSNRVSAIFKPIILYFASESVID